MTVSFPSNPNNGDTYLYNGTVFVFDGVKWVSGGATAYASSAQGALADTAVQRAGDNMTGSLTLGTDKVTLDATDGNATFAGSVKYGGFGYISEGDLGTLYSGSASGSYGIIIGTEPGSTSSAQRKISFSLGAQGASEVASIGPDGSATFAGNITAGNVSDIKFKENITPAQPQLTDVVTLGNSLKNWDWKEEAPLNEGLRSRRFLGLIAQEAEEICPALTYEVGEGEESYKAINHDILVMKLLGAVAELKAELDELKGA